MPTGLNELQRHANGFSHSDAEVVHLYFEVSFAFRVVEPDAAIALT